jgi:hypothetical protein
MKGPFFNRIFLFAFFLLISINKTTQSESTELNMIADASLNATATFASFDHNYYLYFLYDMNPFFADNNFRTGAIFKLTSKKRFYSYDISYFPSSKKIDTINSTDIIGNKVYINWRYLVDLFAQRTTSNEYDHYLKIKSSSLQINSLNTLVIRINVLNKRGDLTIENLLSLSEDIEKALYNKTNNYISYKNLRDSLNKNNYNNNHNKNNINTQYSGKNSNQNADKIRVQDPHIITKRMIAYMTGYNNDKPRLVKTKHQQEQLNTLFNQKIRFVAIDEIINKVKDSNSQLILTDEEKAILDSYRKNDNPHSITSALSIFNEHPITATIRDTCEDLNIIENVRLTKSPENDAYGRYAGVTPNRSIIDINSGKLAKNGLVACILQPNMDGEDANRIRKTDAMVETYHADVRNSVLKMQVYYTEEEQRQMKIQEEILKRGQVRDDDDQVNEEYDAAAAAKLEIETRALRRLEQDRDEIFNRLAVERSEDTLQQYFQNLAHYQDQVEAHEQDEEQPEPVYDSQYDIRDWRNALVNLTDVIYYIPNDDLYEVADYLNDGTIMVGTMHIPKTLTTEPQYIQYGETIEGVMNIYEDTPLEEIVGEQVMMPLTHTKMVMKMNGNKNPYYHPIRFPELNNTDSYLIPASQNRDYILKIHVVQRIDMGATNYIRFSIDKHTIGQAPQDKQHLLIPTGLIYTTDHGKHAKYIRDVNRQYNDRRRGNIAEAAEAYNYEFNNPPQYNVTVDKIKVTGNTIIGPQKRTIIDNRGRDYYAYYRKDGRFFNFSVNFKLDPNFANDFTIKKIDPKLISRATVKLLNMPKIDKENLITIINFINKDAPELQINDAVIPLVARLLDDLLSAEKKIYVLNKWKTTDLINKFKSNEVKIKPESLWDAIKNKCAAEYIELKIKDILKINEQYDEMNPLQDF